jgi:hypothetical protein
MQLHTKNKQKKAYLDVEERHGVLLLRECTADLVQVLRHIGED